ncbi:hypothetical protein [Stenotrophomonas sp. SORGH_AS_0321]|uniref:hypothetical protein n=1 Tax=Stenotrophomonas sp. SORGH_AS_0321 TaxID=3041787 RepID=UPI002856511C|nr:hypothetical protein [Stenotrophomonas sp. SORGH_AS_0321]MDR6094381.1 alpha-ketoglutarate-dependent taurine dioxygenase [Stenotrophomonas sp. SORGH_AS_0321]
MHSQKHTGEAPLSPFGIALAADRAQALMDSGIDTLRALVRQHAVVILRGVGSKLADKEALSRFASWRRRDPLGWSLYRVRPAVE